MKTSAEWARKLCDAAKLGYAMAEYFEPVVRAIQAESRRPRRKRGPQLFECEKCAPYCGINGRNCGCDCHDREAK